jgi:AcrR family transcriptional regulator
VGAPAKTTEHRILDAAYGLFYRRGFTRVGVDEIAARAGVTKRTLYYHYRSKDDLLAAVLEFQHGLAVSRIWKHDSQYRVRTAEQIIAARFSELAKWSLTPGWTGAGFTRLAMELADLPGHPARTIARRHKAEVEKWWASLLKGAGVDSPMKRAQEISVLMEGAIAMILIRGDRSYSEVASRAAIQLVNSETADRARTRRRKKPSRRS